MLSVVAVYETVGICAMSIPQCVTSLSLAAAAKDSTTWLPLPHTHARRRHANPVTRIESWPPLPHAHPSTRTHNSKQGNFRWPKPSNISPILSNITYFRWIRAYLRWQGSVGSKRSEIMLCSTVVVGDTPCLTTTRGRHNLNWVTAVTMSNESHMVMSDRLHMCRRIKLTYLQRLHTGRQT